MGQATSTGGMLLVSMLLLACNHERVDLGGTGASGSTLAAVAGTAGSIPSTPTEVAAAPMVVRRPAGTAQPTPPAVFITPVTTRPSPLLGLTSRAELLPPISGGSLAVAADGSSAVAADPDRDTLYLIDPQSNSVRTLPLPAGSEPGRVVLDDQGQAHAVLRGSGSLARVQLKTAQITLSNPLCRYPRGLAYSAASRTLHLACADGQLVKLSADTYNIVARERHLNDLRDVVIGAMDTTILSRFRSAGLLWQGPSGEVEVQPPDRPWPKVDLSAPSDAQVSAISTQARLAFRSVAAPDGTLWMLHERAQIDALQGDVYSGADTRCGPVIQPALTHFSGLTYPTELDSLQLHGVVAPAVDLAISPDGRWIAIATPAAYAQHRPSVQLHLLDALTEQARIQPQPLDNEFPKSPSDVCAPAGLVGLENESQAVAVAFDRNNLLYIQSRFPARLNIVQAGSTNGVPAASNERSITLSDTDVRDLGHEWFHAEIGKSRVSCAACHAEGLDDAHIWQSSSKGPRRTPSLRGGLLQTAPFAWDGEFSSAETLITQVLQERLEAHDLPAEAVPALAKWLDRLPALSLQSEPNDPAAASGKALFESAELGCSHCHAGAKLTNNQTLDVGSGGAFQVPSLLGLGLRAPYMHDGCANDLNALFTQPECARSGHAQLNALSAAQAADLRAYLESL